MWRTDWKTKGAKNMSKEEGHKALLLEREGSVGSAGTPRVANTKPEEGEASVYFDAPTHWAEENSGSDPASTPAPFLDVPLDDDDDDDDDHEETATGPITPPPARTTQPKHHPKLSDRIMYTNTALPGIISRVPNLMSALADALQPEQVPPVRKARPRLPDYAMQYTSERDKRAGPHRTTTDGDLIDAETGDWLVLDVPASALGKKNTERRGGSGRESGADAALDLPEAKNGATGFDAPRMRKPITRVLKNVLTGSNRPPSSPSLSPSLFEPLPPRPTFTHSADRETIERIVTQSQGGGLSDDELRTVLRIKEAWKMDQRCRRVVLDAMQWRWGAELREQFGHRWIESAIRDGDGEDGFLDRVLRWGRRGAGPVLFGE
jgi:hypothetical protein